MKPKSLDIFDALGVKGFAYRTARKMKAHIVPTIKAHLIRGAFYLLLLPAVFVIPLALGQRGATNSAIDAPKMPSAVRVPSTSRAPETQGSISPPPEFTPIALWDRTVANVNAAVWRNPSGFFGACQSWSRRGVTCGLDPLAPDQVYRVNGNLIFLPTPTPSPTPSPTPTLIVTNTNDSGPGSLRQTLADANNGDVIGFAVTGTIGLTTGELLVTKSITISGPGAENLAVNGNNQSRVFHIASGQTVTISGLTITNGHATDSGGGIYNDHAVLTLNNCVVAGNSAVLNIGAGIHNDGTNIGHAMLQVNNSLITNNSGGIYNDALQAGSATLVITYSTLSNNGPGEAINNDGWSCIFCGNGTTSVEITNSSITSNPGGAIYSDTGRQNCGGSCPVTISITNSTISGNGVGVYNSTLSDAVVSNSTISDNGTGISNNLGALGSSVFNSTMSNNGVEIQNSAGSGSQATIENTIFKISPGGHSIVNESGTVTSYGYNISIDDGAGYLNGPGDQINTDPLLGPLQDNGGPTFTHALLPGSPAINAGDPDFVGPPDYDQRGPDYDRVRGGRIDVGPFEVQEPLPTPTPTPTPTLTPRLTPTPRPHPTPAPRP